ncbi:MAG: HAMP domain-containing histidine kinase [Bacteroidia bacterium]|nr:HAMP domain-containing histidine kinase [Bacteroidia bacterium]MCZ2276815.1 HAMP domain-containing histidine kinase [Bacteroidia bacterium]
MLHPVLEKQVIDVLGFLPSGHDGISILLEHISQFYYQTDENSNCRISDTHTQLIHTNQELARKVKELDQFAYIVSHDLKAPLRNISSIINWIEEDFSSQIPEGMAEHIELIKSRISGMENLIEGILFFSRSNRQSKDEFIQTGLICLEAAELFDPEKKFKLTIQDGMPAFKGQKLQFSQVISNLIGNAMKYSCDNPELEIGYIRLDDCYQFFIQDNGPGIPSVYHQKIFEMFKVIDDHQTKGTGIGLAIVKKIVEGNNGKVWVESEPGRGAKFVFTWPVKPEQNTSHTQHSNKTNHND